METVASYGSAAWGGVSSLIVLLGVFLPEIAILAGFLSDLLNVRVRHMPTSAFGVLAAVLNWIVALIIGPKPENASFFSLPARNAVSSFSSPEASILSKVGSLFGGPSSQTQTRLGVSSPLAPPTPTKNPTRTVNPISQAANAASEVIVAATPATPAPVAESVVNNFYSGYPASGLGEDDRSHFAPNSSVVRSQAARRNAAANATRQRFPSSASQTGGGGAKLADMVNDQFNPCAVRGLGTFDVSKRPMGIAVLTTIFFIYLLDMSVNKKRTTNEQISYWAVASAVLGVNIYAYWTLGCADSILSVAVPLLIGLVVGGSAFAIYQKLGPSYLPMDAEAPSSAASSANAPTGEYSACASGNGGDFVCDAYLNGQRIGTVGGESPKA